MKIDVRFRGIESSDAITEHARRRIHYHLSRFGHEVATVSVRVADDNGPKGGIDKRCRVVVHGPRMGVITLEELTGDVYSAIDGAMERVGRCIGRELERGRSSRHVPLRKLS